MSGDDAQATAWFLIVLGTIAYFFPSIVAVGRHHASAAGIVILNLFLGWSVIGWIIALAWSFSDPRAKGQTVVVHQPAPLAPGSVAASCSGCGSEWTLAPGQTSYTCPKCGTANYLSSPAKQPPTPGPTGF